MSIVVLHGENKELKEKRISDIRKGVLKKGWSIKELSEKNDGIPQQNNLFEENILFVVNISSQISSKNIKKFIETTDETTNALFVFKTALTPGTKKLFPNETKFESFDYPKVIFSLLDSILPKNAKKTQSLLQECRETTKDEITASLFARHLRDMLWSLYGKDTMPYPDWRLAKIESQAKTIGEEKLENMVVSLSNLDIKIKQEGLDTGLALDLFIASNLE